LRNQRYVDYMEIDDDHNPAEPEEGRKRRKIEQASSNQGSDEEDNNLVDNPEEEGEMGSQFGGGLDMTDTQMMIRNELFMHSLPTNMPSQGIVGPPRI
jgi:hypothetical protein